MKKRVTRMLGFSFSNSVNLFLFLQLTAGLLFAIISMGLFLKLAREVFENETVLLDTVVSQFAQGIRNPLLTTCMVFITTLGGEIFLTLSVIVTIILIILKKHRKDAFIFAFILLSGLGLNLLLKQTFQRARPEIMALFVEPTYSFPSGHAMNSFIFYSCLSYFIFLKMKNRRLAGILICTSIVLVILIGLSRIYLGVHYATDVLAGFAAGFFWFVIILLFEKGIKFFRLFKAYELEKKY